MKITAVKKDKNHTVRLEFDDDSSVKLDAGLFKNGRYCYTGKT